MYYLPFLYEMPYLYVLQGAFTAWMLIDCGRRRAETHWFWVILFFPFFGAWIYFFAVKYKGRYGLPALNFWPFYSPPSLDELRHRVEHSPTQANHMDLAQRLIEEGQHADAVPHLEAVLKREPDFCSALYGLAECRLHSSEPAGALPLLEKIIQRDPRWGDYQAWLLLRAVRNRTGDAAGALAACEELVRQSPTLRHRCALAEQLLEQGRKDEARTVLEKGMADFQYAPRPIRWRNRQWVNAARRLQKRILQENR
jgi:hypothetical protein